MRLHRRAWALVIVPSMLVVAACGSTSHKADPPPKPTTPPSVTSVASTTATTTPSDQGQDPAILAAYQGSLADFNAVSTHVPLQPNSPVLANHRVGEDLQHVVSSLLQLAEHNQVDTGSLTSLSAKVTQFNGTQAVVVSCELDRSAVVDATTHQVVTPASNSTEMVNALVEMNGGTWKVTQGSNVHPGCP